MLAFNAGQTAGLQRFRLTHKRSTEIRFGFSPLPTTPQREAFATALAEMVEDGFYNREDQREHGTITLGKLMKLGGHKVRGIDGCLSRGVATILVARKLIGRIPGCDDVFTFGDPKKALAALRRKPE